MALCSNITYIISCQSLNHKEVIYYLPISEMRKNEDWLVRGMAFTGTRSFWLRGPIQSLAPSPLVVPHSASGIPAFLLGQRSHVIFPYFAHAAPSAWNTLPSTCLWLLSNSPKQNPSMYYPALQTCSLSGLPLFLCFIIMMVFVTCCYSGIYTLHCIHVLAVGFLRAKVLSFSALTPNS